MIQELKPTKQKSFYKKAMVEINKNDIRLYSYETLVIEITKTKIKEHNKELWTKTTKKHIKEFMKQYCENNK